MPGLIKSFFKLGLIQENDAVGQLYFIWRSYCEAADIASKILEIGNDKLPPDLKTLITEMVVSAEKTKLINEKILASD